MWWSSKADFGSVAFALRGSISLDHVEAELKRDISFALLSRRLQNRFVPNVKISNTSLCPNRVIIVKTSF
jgi:hypothetical protein